MANKARVYTRTGDGGTSQLLSVGRVPKDHPRLVLYGDVDELNSAIGLALAHDPAPPLPDQLRAIQHKLFKLGSQIAVPDPEAIGFPIPAMAVAETEELERWIDAADAELPPLKQFILPGGSRAAGHLHLARTICRRCERDLQGLHRDEPVPAPVHTYLNRLSDYLFVAARHDNHRQGLGDVLLERD